MSQNFDSMVVDKEYKKKLIGYIDPRDLSEDLDNLLKSYDAENIQPDLEKTKKILSKVNVNDELLHMRESQ